VLLPDSLVARVTDRFGNPIPGESIAWHTGDGGAISDAETSTDADGCADPVADRR